MGETHIHVGVQWVVSRIPSLVKCIKQGLAWILRSIWCHREQLLAPLATTRYSLGHSGDGGIDTLLPVVGTRGILPEPNEPASFVGYLTLDKLRHRKMNNAVSTSHCSQPTTLEYRMAIEWCLQQAKSDLYWKKLHEVLRISLSSIPFINFI
ncbi:hypothetical protein Pint_30028 [Pistacia integerrima]|uniref:Uncharacterized protein n=1 Tax=Pistacia integerrima TaxID=434235 RepID=A0ACC0X3T6_9ROSI|nr:hypothetical protein Pint_30028 [Pistacia integerrima]